MRLLRWIFIDEEDPTGSIIIRGAITVLIIALLFVVLNN